jgi:hypothetical protein
MRRKRDKSRRYREATLCAEHMAGSLPRWIKHMAGQSTKVDQIVYGINERIAPRNIRSSAIVRVCANVRECASMMCDVCVWTILNGIVLTYFTKYTIYIK